MNRALARLLLLAFGLTLAGAAGCQCNSGLRPLEPALIAVAPVSLSFPATYVGSLSTAVIQASNLGQQSAQLELTTSATFSVERALTLSGGESLAVQVHFAPMQPGHVDGVLKVGTLEVALSADGLEVPECRAPDACTTSAFDSAAAACVSTSKPEGAACETQCVIGGCHAGACLGALRGCDDQDACTVDACGEAQGCTHHEAECAAPANPCQESRCASPLGCILEDKPDGTLCGPDDCKSTQLAVCIAAHCVQRARPDTGRCANRWVPTGLFGRRSHAMAYDPVRKRVVLFGGSADAVLGDTWEWDGTSWLERTPANSPPARSGEAMAYDAARKRIVLFGGGSGALGPGADGLFDDTWEWDGTTWLQRTPASKPPPRQAHAMAYDSARQRVVLFGGGGDVSHRILNDTWEWDGASWTQRTTTVAPPGRQHHAMAFDAIRHRTVVFGGEKSGNGPATNDTWLWDGTSWAQAASAPVAASRKHHAMAFDLARQRIVVAGGASSSGTLEFDGTSWVERAAALVTPPVRSHAMAYDASRQQIVLFGGSDPSGGLVGRTWTWNGAVWTPQVQPLTPSARRGHAMAYDALRQRTVLFGGYGGSAFADTWEWDGAGWSQLSLGPGPPYRNGHRMAYDAAAQHIVLFGGYAEGNTFGDTWQYAGSWSPRQTGSPPHSRGGHAAAWDSARQRLVIFGGFETDGAGGPLPLLGDTWEWDGTSWLQHTPATSPPALERSAMAFDVTRQRAVLFGGRDASGGVRNGTWEWDGATWLVRTPGASPSARDSHAMAWDADRQRVVLFGGTGLSAAFNDTWEWDGTTWTQRAVAAAPPGGDFAIAYDQARQRMTAFGSGTWVLLP